MDHPKITERNSDYIVFGEMIFPFYEVHLTLWLDAKILELVLPGSKSGIERCFFKKLY